ncbi:uncharacterized protein (TIGR00369 family) [Weissella uvarum]|uniref:PaaI family thioesterase n=1 Tax=Weissella uvarum TaxID=1479233 RepID=UPI0019620984|nr:PaaI family thioesterase [Weissella uvarum]MBM7616887.1 uncharacterized protein (TIGR00369 family) [Weissella uvarum]MCM0594661.1 PaaI family thioesterase [Weissella uvarum]
MNAVELFDIQTIVNDYRKVVLSMPVSEQTLQPFGMLHGGISAMLAETAASMGANTVLNDTNQFAVGVDLNIHHLNSVSQGTLEAVAIPLHTGRRIQTWQVDIYETQQHNQIASATVTLTNHQKKE